MSKLLLRRCLASARNGDSTVNIIGRRLSTNVAEMSEARVSRSSSPEQIMSPSTFPLSKSTEEEVKAFVAKSKAPSKKQLKHVPDIDAFLSSLEEKLEKKLLISRHDIDAIMSRPCTKPEEFLQQVKALTLFQQKGFDFEFRHCDQLVQNGLAMKQYDELAKILLNPSHRIASYLTEETLQTLVTEFAEVEGGAQMDHLSQLLQSTVHRGLQIITKGQVSQVLSFYQAEGEKEETKVKVQNLLQTVQKVLSEEEFQQLQQMVSV